MRLPIYPLLPLFLALALGACGIQEDYRLTLDCRGIADSLSKQGQQPADNVSREEGRRYAFAWRGLDGYTCHTWRSDKIACILAQDDEGTYVHESVTIHRDDMTVTHVATIEKKLTGLVREESFQGKCVKSAAP